MLALAAIVAALQAPPPPPPPCTDPAAGLQCPDLIMGIPRDLRTERSPTGRRVLRMRNAIINVGTGPAAR